MERKRGFSFCDQIAQKMGKSIEKRVFYVPFDTSKGRILTHFGPLARFEIVDNVL